MQIYKEIEHNGKMIQIAYCQEEDAFKKTEASKYIIDSHYAGICNDENVFSPMMRIRYKIPVNTPVEITQYVGKVYADYRSQSTYRDLDNIELIEHTEDYVIFDLLNSAICNAMVEDYGMIVHGCWFEKHQDKIEEIFKIPEITQAIKNSYRAVSTDDDDVINDEDMEQFVQNELDHSKEYGLMHHCSYDIIDAIAFYHKIGDTTINLEGINDEHGDAEEIANDIIEDERNGNIDDVCRYSDVNHPLIMDLNDDAYVLYVLTHED